MIIFAFYICYLVSAIRGTNPVQSDLGLYSKPASRLILNPLSIFGNPRCAYNGVQGSCYGEVECLALAGTYGNFCPGLQGLCCLFYRSCGQRSSQEVIYFRNVQYPLEDRAPDDCGFQVVKRSDEYCGIRVSMEKVDLPAKSGGTCEDVYFQVKGIHNNQLKPKCGRLTGKSYRYSMAHVGDVFIHITSPRATTVSWNLKVEQVKCSEWEGEDFEEISVGGDEEEGGGGGGSGSGGSGSNKPSVVFPPPLPTHPPTTSRPTTSRPTTSRPTAGPIGPPAPPTSTFAPITGGGGGSGSSGSFSRCGVKGPSFNQGSRQHGSKLVAFQGSFTSDRASTMARRRKTPNRNRPSFINRRVTTKSEKRPLERPAQRPPFVPGSIGSDAAISSTEWGVPNLNNTLFGHYAGKPSPLSTRITFGNLAGIREFPWQIAMTVRGKFHCGASLISNYHVLTAAHCVVAYKNSPSIIDLSLGDWDLSTSADGKSIKAKASRVTTHPGYSRSTLQNDVAVLKLNQKVEFTERIRPICLPPSNINVEGDRATVSGWGRNEAAKLQTQLHYLEAAIISNSQCDSRWNNNGAARGFIVNSMLCMDSTSGDSCNGDSGGPSVLEYPSGSGSYVQVGLVSFGSGSCTDASLPGVYTRVGHYLSWIKQQMT